jgi:Uma2 family endonuclease
MIKCGMSETLVSKHDLPNDLLWRLSVGKYHEMIRLGVLTDDDPVELLEGWLVEKMPRNPAHTFSTESSRDLLQAALPQGYFVNSQQSITTSDSEPEPDNAVIRGRREDYLEHHPFPKDVVLVIEVADSSLRHDQTVKGRIYAVAGILEYWIINLVEKQLEVYTQPSAEQGIYKQRQIYSLTDSVPLRIEGKEVTRLPVQSLFPNA